ncbi:MAG: amidohydrolase family protein, partial [Acidimicrobiales bacterium]
MTQKGPQQAQAGAPGKQRCDLLLTGGCVVTVDDQRRVLDPGAVAITGDRIVAVGPVDELHSWLASRSIDCSGRAVIPGLVDCHNHLFQALVRGLGEGLSIWPWLCEFMWPYSIAMTPEDARVAVTLGAIEAVRAGTTTVIDNHYAPTDEATTLAVAEAIESVGLRGAVARGILGTKSPVAERRGLPDELFRYTTEEELEITRNCMATRPPGSTVSVWPAPLNLAYVDQDVVARSIELAASFSAKWHTHCSEGQKDPTSYLEAYSIRPVEWLYRAGLLDASATLAHAIWLDEAEIHRIGEAHAGAAHNPTSNAYLASGRMPVQELRREGTSVGLGSDGPSCGHRQDLFECMKQAVFVQRLQSLDPTSMRCEVALELATREGARVAGVDAGVLEPGKLADVVVVRLDTPHLQPVHRAVATLVYSARGSDVEYTICGGEIVFAKGSCTRVDEEEAMRRAREHARGIVQRTGMAS